MSDNNKPNPYTGLYNLSDAEPPSEWGHGGKELGYGANRDGVNPVGQPGSDATTSKAAPEPTPERAEEKPMGQTIGPQQSYRRLQLRVEELEAENAGLRGRTSGDFLDRAKRAERERDRLSQQLHDSKARNAESNMENDRLRKTCKGLIRSCYKRARERNELRSEIELMTAHPMADVIAQRDSYKATLVRANELYDAAMQERDEAQAEAARGIEASEVHLTVIDELRAEVERVSAIANKNADSCSALSDEVDRLRQQLAEAKEELKAEQHCHANSQRGNQRLSDENKALKTELAERDELLREIEDVLPIGASTYDRRERLRIARLRIANVLGKGGNDD